MKTINYNINLDPAIKAKAEETYAEFGLNLSEAINVFLHMSIKFSGFPFEIRLDTPNEETLTAIQDVNLGRNMSREFHSVKELMEDLDADD